MMDDIAVRAWDAKYASERCGPAAARGGIYRQAV
jgi:hypothetical protein